MAERERCPAYGCTVWRCPLNTWGNHSVDNVCVWGEGGGRRYAAYGYTVWRCPVYRCLHLCRDILDSAGDVYLGVWIQYGGEI